MTDLKLQLKITADGAGAAQVEIDRLSGSLGKIDPATRAAAAGAESFGRAISTASGLIAGMGLASLVGDLRSTAAELQNVRVRLDYFAGSAKAGAAAQEELRQVARSLNADYLTLADSYGRLIPLEQSGLITHQQTRDILIGLTNAGKALGASNAQLGQTYFGLAQALSAPKLKAEELNQVMEPLPGLLQAMDRAAQLPAGGFRALTVEGKVTSEMFATTLVKALKEFEGAAVANANTIDGAGQRMKTAWQETAATWEKPINFAANGLADFLEGVNTRLQLLGELAAESPLFKSNSRAAVGKDVWDYMAETEARNRALFGGGSTGGYGPAPSGFTGPTIPEEELKARREEVARAEKDAAEAARKSAQEQEAAQRTLTQSKIELLKAEGQYAEALQLEARLRGLAGDQARQYVETELAAIEAKNRSTEATRRATDAARDREKAEASLLKIIEATETPWDKYQRQIAEVEKAMAVVSLGSADLARLSQGLTEQLNRERQAWSQSDEAMASHVRLYEQQQERKAAVIDQYQQEITAIQMTAEQREIYLAQQQANVRADSVEGQQIAGLITYYQGLKKEQEAISARAGEYEQAWIQAVRNIQTAAGNLFADMASGQKTTIDGLLGSLTSASSQYAGQRAALSLRRATDQYTKGAETGGVGGGLSAINIGDLLSGMSPAIIGAIAAWITPKSVFEGQPKYMRTPSLEAGIETINSITNAIGDLGGWFAIAKLIAPIREFSQRMALSAYPDRKQSLGGYIAGDVFLGPIAGSFLASLLGDVVKSSAGYSYSSDKGLRHLSSYTQNGAPLGALEAAGSSLTNLTGISRALGIDIPYLSASYQNRGARMNITGYNANGEQFYQSSNFRVTQENVEGQQRLFVTAILKRQEVTKQFDDFMLRSAFDAAENLNDIRANAKAVGKLRAFEGDVGGNAASLGQTWNSYNAGMDLIERIAPGGKKRRAEVAKLNQALTRKFENEIFDLQRQMDAATGSDANDLAAQLRGVAATMQDLRARDQALRDFAKRSKGKVSYTGLTAEEFASAEAAAVKQVVQAYFEAASSGVEAAAESVGNSVQSILDEIAGPDATLQRLQADIGTGMAALYAATDPNEAATKAQEITGLILKRYDIEAQAIREQIAAAEELKSLVDDLQAGDLSALPWVEQFGNTRSQFEAVAARVSGGDLSAASLNDLNTAARSYLGFAQQGYGTGSAEYRAVASAVQSLLERYATPASAESQIGALKTATEAQLQAITAALQPILDRAVKASADQVTQVIQSMPRAVSSGVSQYLGDSSPVAARLDKVVVNTEKTAKRVLELK